ncbi:hypothetical protein N9018_04990, partial [Rhodopirellula sp.]|nr:hypothetical protein [Rhodopirellula sp.]
SATFNYRARMIGDPIQPVTQFTGDWVRRLANGAKATIQEAGVIDNRRFVRHHPSSQGFLSRV